MKSNRIILGIFIFTFGIVLLVSYWTNVTIAYSINTMEYNIEKRLNVTAQMLADLVMAEELDEYRDVADMALPEYQALRAKLLDFSLEMDVLYAYFIRPSGEDLYFIVDNDFDETTRVGLDSPPFDLVDAPWIGRAIAGETINAGLGNYQYGWEGLLTSYAPVLRADGTVAAIAGVDIVDEAIVRAQLMVGILTAVQVFMVVAVFISGMISFFRFRREAKTAGEASTAKSDFLASMSHEIRTPLNAIIGITQIQLQKDGLTDEDALAYGKIFNSGRNMLGIVNDILDMSKIEMRKMELSLAEYDAPELINDAVQLNMVRIGEKPIEFIVDIEESLPQRLYGDELRLKQILNNLLSNAIKYTEKGHVKLSIRHSGHGNEAMLHIIVEDTGHGMKAEDTARLFTEYLRFGADTQRTIEGTGLGLAITKRLVELMGGTIGVESEYGTGSVFTVMVQQPAATDAVIGAETAGRLCDFTYDSERKAGELSIVIHPMPHGSALVVDDMEINLFVAQGLLSLYELKVETVKSGFAAIDAITGGKIYDVIFMDHMMPHMDGVETTKQLRALGYSGAIVALTANALMDNDKIFAENGFDGFISKPIDILRLDEVLNMFIPIHEYKAAPGSR